MRVPRFRKLTRGEVFTTLTSVAVVYLLVALVIVIASNASTDKQLLQDHRETRSALLKIKTDEARFCRAARATHYAVIIKILCPGGMHG